MISQQVLYECKPVLCSDCGGIGHNMEQRKQKRFEVAKAKSKPKQWVPKHKPRAQSNIEQPAQHKLRVILNNLLKLINLINLCKMVQVQVYD